LGRNRDDQFAMNQRERAGRHDETTVRRTREGGDAALDLPNIADVDWIYLYV
jgi:hypothetical protein